ncbi:hypothetical protein RN001_015433 [Aquatica leii]|uniref:Major facilitator superfamily (MFS) profile domain-containing protein n=1 Tax=Aquatica leii TaxID=1421715 RepID=A0AAN7SDC4_9COLE|nr:hypothetical protein RN001_015433 [Aquatica leii]
MMKIQLRGKLLQFFVFFAGSINVLLCGLHLGWPSPSVPQLLSSSSVISLTNDEGSWLASILLIGGICGAILSAVILDIIGRKKMMLLTSLALFGAWLMIAFAHTVLELYIARFIAGISDGFVFCCLPLYLAEVGASEIRGFLLSGITVAYVFGVFLANLLGSFFNIATVALLSSALSLGAICSCLFIPESPYFYVINGDIDKAKISMQLFSGRDAVETSLNIIINDLKEQKKEKGNWLQVFTDASNRKSFWTVVLLRFFQQSTGFIGIVFYTQTLFKSVSADVSSIVFVSIFYSLQIFGSIINAVIIDRIGRRPLVIVSMFTIIVALFIITCYFTLQNLSQIDVTMYYWLLIFGFFLFIVGYSIGLHNIPILLIGEIFPLHVKAFAAAIIDIFYGLFSTMVSKFFQYTKDEFGVHVPFIAFTICSVCSMPFIIYCIPETKGKTLEEIQNQLQNKKKSKI